jgi:hypothetical protein
MKVRPVEFSLIDKIGSQARDHLDQIWTKALTRVGEDPDGAVTAARSFLEATCKHVLEAVSVSYGSNLDLLQLFRRVSDELRLSVTADMGRVEKQFYSGTYNVVQSLTELRNQVGDAHGKGQLETKPSSAQAELALNLAGGVAAFLLRRLDSHLAVTRRLTSAGNAILRFDKATVWRLVDHAQNSPDHAKAMTSRRKGPAIWLVADAGIYLMSNGLPALMATGRLAREGKGHLKPRLVAHAEGCGPFDEIDDWHPLQVAMSGGDDFCEPLAIRDIRNALEVAKTHIVIVSNATHYKIHPDTRLDEQAAELKAGSDIPGDLGP